MPAHGSRDWEEDEAAGAGAGAGLSGGSECATCGGRESAGGDTGSHHDTCDHDHAPAAPGEGGGENAFGGRLLVRRQSFHEIKRGRLFNRSITLAAQLDKELQSWHRPPQSLDDVGDLKARWRAHKKNLRVGKSGRVFGFRESQRDFFAAEDAARALEASSGAHPTWSNTQASASGDSAPRRRQDSRSASASLNGRWAIVEGVRVFKPSPRTRKAAELDDTNSTGNCATDELSASNTFKQATRTQSLAKRVLKKLGSGLKNAARFGRSPTL
eukprot:CAMPEP_0172019050 /NCGR_PEP_ID=MMETSP1041-20130122/12433_1 /TAXON_ID=464988 /ORGANISM="Hemiselmis andersenii, Strain CCMP439" /LENGTH=270 /DNA_ID=CAMNT_0012674205 /DNA_START=72 /DNA_END=884 /DNA_ORIENTATION=+